MIGATNHLVVCPAASTLQPMLVPEAALVDGQRLTDTTCAQQLLSLSLPQSL